MTAHNLLIIEDEAPGVRMITLNRPDRLNALSVELIEALHAAFDAADADERVRAVVLTGAGRGFCAGFDLKSDRAAELAKDGPMAVPARLLGQSHWSAAVGKLRKMRPVIIAAVNGPAAGGGLGLALAADLRVAAPSASFIVANIRIGLSGGEMGISYALPRLVGTGRAAELMLTGRSLSAAEALGWGLVNSVADDAKAAALQLAGSVVANSRFGVEMTKELLALAVDAPNFEAVEALENRTQVLASMTGDMAAAVGAFADRRAD
jgi:enoyl-CoA hydratase